MLRWNQEGILTMGRRGKKEKNTPSEVWQRGEKKQSGEERDMAD